MVFALARTIGSVEIVLSCLLLQNQNNLLCNQLLFGFRQNAASSNCMWFFSFSFFFFKFFWEKGDAMPRSSSLGHFLLATQDALTSHKIVDLGETRFDVQKYFVYS